MKIMELTQQQFDEYSKYNPSTNYCQTSKYALIMTNYGYTYDFIGYVDDEKHVQAASLILTKRLQGHNYYGYAPKGFLINYTNKELTKNFINDLRKYYKRRGFVLIKFNPEIIIGTTDRQHNFQMNYNAQSTIMDEFKRLGIKRRTELQEFDLLEPKRTAYINLKNYSLNSISRQFRKKIRKASSKGLRLTVGEAKDVEILYEMMKGKTQRPLAYYRDIYNVYSKDNSIDLVFIQVDYQQYLARTQEIYTKEQDRNDYLNELFFTNPKVYSQKINSDKRLQAYKEDIITATEGLKRNPSAIIAGALVIKHFNRITVFASGYRNDFKKLQPNHFLYHAICERYKPYFNYCDMNGVTYDFSKESKYYGLNHFKLKFNPTLIEFIGELDLICNDWAHHKLMKTSFIEDEFAKFH